MSHLIPIHFHVPSLIFGPRNFLRKLLAQFISYLAGIYPYGVSHLTPIHFRVPSLIFGPLGAKYLTENGVSRIKKKTIGSIHYIPGIYRYGESFLTPIHFHVPNLIFGPLRAKYLAENGVSGTFWKNYWFHSKFSWRIPTCVAHDCKIEIFIVYFWMRWVVIRAWVYCPPFMSTACCVRSHGWTRRYALVGLPVSALHVERQAIPQLLSQKRGQFLQCSVKSCGLVGNPAIRFLLPSNG